MPHPGIASNLSTLPPPRYRPKAAFVYSTCIVGVIGDDANGAILKSELDQKGICTSGIAVDESRPTILKGASK